MISVGFLNRTLLLVAWAIGLNLAAAPAARAEQNAPASEAARLLARNLPRLHISHRPLDNPMAAAALDIYLSSLDYEHAYFLAGDIADFQRAVECASHCNRAGLLRPEIPG
jgi:hypothetical protein